MARTPYDVTASWDDPFERPKERRTVARAQARFKVKIAVNLANKPAPLVGPGVVCDISATGLRCRTKHRLAQGQAIRLFVPTKGFPTDLGFPKSFLGGAQVVRTKSMDDGVFEVAVRFDEDLRDDIQMAVFVDHLHSLAPAANA